MLILDWHIDDRYRLPMTVLARRRLSPWVSAAFWLSAVVMTAAGTYAIVELISGVATLLPGSTFQASLPVSVPLPPGRGALFYSGPHVAVGTSVTFTEATATVANGPLLSPASALVGHLVLTATVALVAFGTFQIARDARASKPFSRRASRSLGLIAIALAIGPLVGEFADSLSRATLGGVQYIAAQGDLIVDTTRFDIDWFPILGSLALAALSAIFRNAVSMQDEIDTLI